MNETEEWVKVIKWKIWRIRKLGTNQSDAIKHR